ncbi:MAG: hypothetical protein EAZ50_02130 [Runella slithyformis]|jgi:hypothetical protein|nr:MAG: hypothetical protein EAY79_02410 [Runella slithyformis]TAF83069.1 MAG: hypothetical protein EAZ50_02130 [Runella slithyformis]
MKKSIILLSVIFQVTLYYSYAQFAATKAPIKSQQQNPNEFIPLSYNYNKANLSYFVMQSGDTLKGAVITVKAKNAFKLIAGDISSFVMKSYEKDTEIDVKLTDIKEAYLAITYAKDEIVVFDDNTPKEYFIDNPWKDKEIDFNKHFTYVKNLKIADEDGKEETVFVTLVNPSFASKIKVFQAKTGGRSSSNGGKEVANTNYLQLENGELLVVKRKGFKEVAQKIFAGCDKITSEKYLYYEKLSDYVYAFNQGLCK